MLYDEIQGPMHRFARIAVLSIVTILVVSAVCFVTVVGVDWIGEVGSPRREAGAAILLGVGTGCVLCGNYLWYLLKEYLDVREP